MKILVVDDEKSIRNTMKDILEYEGYEVVLAEKGENALEAAAAHSFDVIFCDIKMPETDCI